MGLKSTNLEGNRVLVIGGSSGIGKATVQLLLESKAKVTAIGRKLEPLENLKKEINNNSLSFESLDMTDEDKVKDYFLKFQKDSIDHVIITASTSVHGPFLNTDINQIKGMFNSKFFGPYTIALYATPKIKKNGSITFFSGVLSRRPGKILLAWVLLTLRLKD
ncbi:MAG: SDR family NAD(P)-dependent oxidoreductase [Candidatus Caenarcaniphilales bacterium]|nr:SDR family NAD(P)-dependent oxidoreductase [Candidatus Caenarcaniphilales bacterium]